MMHALTLIARYAQAKGINEPHVSISALPQESEDEKKFIQTTICVGEYGSDLYSSRETQFVSISLPIDGDWDSYWTQPKNLQMAFDAVDRYSKLQLQRTGKATAKI